MINLKSKKIVSSLLASLTLAVSVNAASLGSVNGKEITSADVQVVLRNPQIDFNALPKESKDQILDQIVQKMLLTEEAVRSDVDKSDLYKEALAKLKEDLALEFWMRDEYNKIKVSEKDLKDFYEKNKEKFQVPATFESRHILVKTEKEAKDIIAELDKATDKKAKFIDLAKMKSTGPTGPKGGYLGKTPAKAMVPEFSQAALALEKGKYSKSPVKTQFGYHVIYLEDKIAASTLEFDKVKAQIEQAVKQEKFAEAIQAKVKALKEKAKIVIK